MVYFLLRNIINKIEGPERLSHLSYVSYALESIKLHAVTLMLVTKYTLYSAHIRVVHVSQFKDNVVDYTAPNVAHTIHCTH